LVQTKEDIEKKLNALVAKLPNTQEKITKAPVSAEVERNEKKYKIKPQLIAKKSARKVKKKINHLKKLLSKAS